MIRTLASSVLSLVALNLVVSLKPHRFAVVSAVGKGRSQSARGSRGRKRCQRP